ncbi:MAG: replicative DNA helicase [Elusimicrobiales bacterium]
MNTKIYPQALDAEMSVLGTMIISRDAIQNVVEILKPEHFYLEIHQIIFDTIIKLYDAKKSIDIVVLAEELKRLNELEKIGGIPYLTQLTEHVSSPAHAKDYAQIVKEKYILRELIKASSRIIEEAYSQSKDLDTVVDQAQREIFNISQKNLSHQFTSPKDLAREYLNIIEDAKKEGKPILGIPSGFSRLDSITAGFKNQEFIILAARPSQGKTALALNIAYNVGVRKNIPVIIFSLEMDRYSLIHRMISSAIKYNSSKIRSGRIEREIWPALTTEIGKFSDSNIWIDDTPGLTIMDIRTRARKLILDIQSKNPQINRFLIIIDYLQLIRGIGRHESRQQEVSEISRLLKDMARSLNLPVLALSQLNRRTEERSREGNRPQLSDLRESGSLEQDADIVLMIHREYYYTRDESKRRNATLIVAKNRQGMVGEVDLLFFEEYTRFEEPLPNTIQLTEEEISL